MRTTALAFVIAGCIASPLALAQTRANTAGGAVAASQAQSLDAATTAAARTRQSAVGRTMDNLISMLREAGNRQAQAVSAHAATGAKDVPTQVRTTPADEQLSARVDPQTAP